VFTLFPSLLYISSLTRSLHLVLDLPIGHLFIHHLRAYVTLFIISYHLAAKPFRIYHPILLYKLKDSHMKKLFLSIGFLWF
jgi:hypothetical protein